MTDRFEYLNGELIIIEVEKIPHLFKTKALDYKDRAVKVEALKCVFREVVGDLWSAEFISSIYSSIISSNTLLLNFL